MTNFKVFIEPFPYSSVPNFTNRYPYWATIACFRDVIIRLTKNFILRVRTPCTIHSVQSTWSSSPSLPRSLPGLDTSFPRMSALDLLVSLLCLHLHPRHSVEAEINRGSRLGTRQFLKAEQTKLLTVAKQLYVDGDLFCAFHPYK